MIDDNNENLKDCLPVLLGIYDFKERSIEYFDENNYDDIYYLFCRDLISGNVIIISSYNNELTKAVKYYKKRLIKGKNGLPLTIKQFYELENFYFSCKLVNGYVELDSLIDEVNSYSEINEKKLRRKR